MALTKRYNPTEVEPRLAARWAAEGIYHFEPNIDPVYSIDTPPATVSGYLHLGHVYSYSHADFIARFRRMNGANVYYPMGYDDNGLPTERLVERETGVSAEQLGREEFIARCLQLTRTFEEEYQRLWQRLGLSVDWRYSYRTIDDLARRTAQENFLDLATRDLAYRREAPAIWCPHCHTAIAQADVNDLERDSRFVTLAFTGDDGWILPIATTRPELLPACVAVFVHPEDGRYRALLGTQVRTPLFDLTVPVLADVHADQAKGTGAVMCCTFGDTADVEWWYSYHLPLREALDRSGRLTALAGEFAGMTSTEARGAMIAALAERGAIIGDQPVRHTVRVHERCDTPVEFIVTRQWFIRLLDHKDEFLRAGEAIDWYPAAMANRYREWVENLKWDWCISRQRYYGVPFPVWFCSCGQVLLAERDQLPVDPTTQSPPRSCTCGSTEWTPERDVMDTWATSSLSPQIAGRLLSDPELYHAVFPLALHPQAHEIIRTWAFYTIVMSQYRSNSIPWQSVLISGWGLAPGGSDKISKSRGSSLTSPQAMLERYSADAARYWAASTGPGRDAVISEEKISAGAKLATKLWNVAAFAGRFLEGEHSALSIPALSPADRWLLGETQTLIAAVTQAFSENDYATAKNTTEAFFWNVLADNYLEMAKKRLYDAGHPGHAGARFALHHALLANLKLFAPILPYVTDEVYLGLFQSTDGHASIHRSPWPRVDQSFLDPAAHPIGEALVAVANAVRRYKSDHRLSLGAELTCLQVHWSNARLAGMLRGAEDDLASVTRARVVLLGNQPDPGAERVEVMARDIGPILLGITP